MKTKNYLFLSLFLFTLIPTSYAWYSNWGMRKSVNFTENSGFDLNNGLKEYWFNHEGNALADCGDIRVTDSSDNLQKYNITNCNSTHVYIAQPVNLTANGTSTYYIYYNKTGATTTSVTREEVIKGGDSDLFKEETGTLYWQIDCANDGTEDYGLNDTTVINGSYSLFVASGNSHGTGCNDIYNQKYWGHTIESNTSTGLWSGYRQPNHIEFFWNDSGGNPSIVYWGSWIRFGDTSYREPVLYDGNGTWYYNNRTANYHFQDLTRENWYKMEYDIDWDNYLVNISVDNVLKATNQLFNYNHTKLNYIEVYDGSQDGYERTTFFDNGLALFDVSESIGNEETLYISVTFNYSSVSFGSMGQGSSNNPAQDQTSGVYNVTIDTNSNYEVLANATDLTDGVHSFAIGNMTMGLNTTAGNLDVSDSVSLSTSPVTIETNLPSSDTVNYHGFWVTIPNYQYASTYQSNMTITYQNM